MADLSIIIVTHNSSADIDRCLSSVRDDGTRRTVETFVVDNASTDGSPALVREKHSWAILIQNDGNVGFATANNRAIRQSSGRYIMLLNPDTRLQPGVLDGLAGYLDANPAVWGAGPGLFNPDGTAQRTGVCFPSNWNILVEALFLDRLFPLSRIFGRHRQIYEDPSEPRCVDFVHGVAFIVRRSAIEKVGFLDSDYFMYFEETDWCYRMKQAGGVIEYAPVGGVVHYGGAETGHFDERRLVHYHESLLHFYEKHYRAWRMLLLRPILLLRSLVRILAWGGLYVAQPARRAAALSVLRGYMRVTRIAVG